MYDEASVRATIHSEFPYLEINVVKDIYIRALYDYLNLRFPFDKSITSIPKGSERDYVWVKKRMVDIIERAGASSAIAYSENGLSIRFDDAGISSELSSQVIPNMGVLW